MELERGFQRNAGLRHSLRGASPHGRQTSGLIHDVLLCTRRATWLPAAAVASLSREPCDQGDRHDGRTPEVVLPTWPGPRTSLTKTSCEVLLGYFPVPAHRSSSCRGKDGQIIAAFLRPWQGKACGKTAVSPVSLALRPRDEPELADRIVGLQTQEVVEPPHCSSLNISDEAVRISMSKEKCPRQDRSRARGLRGSPGKLSEHPRAPRKESMGPIGRRIASPAFRFLEIGRAGGALPLLRPRFARPARGGAGSKNHANSDRCPLAGMAHRFAKSSAVRWPCRSCRWSHCDRRIMSSTVLLWPLAIVTVPYRT